MMTFGRVLRPTFVLLCAICRALLFDEVEELNNEPVANALTFVSVCAPRQAGALNIIYRFARPLK